MLIPPLSGSLSVKLRPAAPARRRPAPRRRTMIAPSRAPVDMGTPLRFSPLCGFAAHRRNEHTVVPGRAAPSQTLPRVGAWGNPVSPCPCVRARSSCGRGRGETRFPHPPRRGRMFTLGCSWEGYDLPNPPTGWEYGETRFPHTPAPAAYVHVRRSCARRTTPQ